jgi:RNA polymerase sigma-70 factor (ECF subfamily)
MKWTQHERDEVHWLIAQEIPALRRYAHVLMGKTPERRDDLVQDTLERALNKSHTWRREGNIRSWLYRIQYSVFISRYSKTHLKEVFSEDIGEETAISSESAAQEHELEYKRVIEATYKLKPRHREVLVLVAIEGMSYDEVAQIMDIPVGTVRSRLARAREELRAELENPSPRKTNTPSLIMRRKNLRNVK